MARNISLKQAQQIILSSQGLTGRAVEPLQIIEHLGYVQIDTISVVERAHHHVFWTRNTKYKPSQLGDLVKSRKVFEYWSHAASFLPMKDYRYTLPMKMSFRKKCWFPKDTKVMNHVLKRIRTEGPLRSKDFKSTEKNNSGWWDWKLTKHALERLFLEGKLEVSRREGFQKVYDLPERVIPSIVDTTMPTEQEYLHFLIHRTLRHHGLATSNEISYLKKGEFKRKIEKQLVKMALNQEVVEVAVDGVSESYYALPESLVSLSRATSKILILSPFDNLVIQRKKLSTFFNFDYQIECYVPEKKRQYGYFCLPIFKGSQPLARIDCKVHRKSQVLEIKSLHCEKGQKRSKVLDQIETKLKAFAKFNGCHSIQF